MISMQIVDNNLVKKGFLLIWLFLLISLFLSLPAKGNVLDIDNEYYEGPGEKVTFTFWVKNAANPVERFGCTVQYDKNIFEYMEHYKGNLAESFPFLSVKEWWNGYELKISGSGGNIKEGDSGSLISLAFKLKKCEESTLELLNLR